MDKKLLLASRLLVGATLLSDLGSLGIELASQRLILSGTLVLLVLVGHISLPFKLWLFSSIKKGGKVAICLFIAYAIYSWSTLFGSPLYSFAEHVMLGEMLSTAKWVWARKVFDLVELISYPIAVYFIFWDRLNFLRKYRYAVLGLLLLIPAWAVYFHFHLPEYSKELITERIKQINGSRFKPTITSFEIGPKIGRINGSLELPDMAGTATFSMTYDPYDPYKSPLFWPYHSFNGEIQLGDQKLPFSFTAQGDGIGEIKVKVQDLLVPGKKFKINSKNAEFSFKAFNTVNYGHLWLFDAQIDGSSPR